MNYRCPLPEALKAQAVGFAEFANGATEEDTHPAHRGGWQFWDEWR